MQNLTAESKSPKQTVAIAIAVTVVLVLASAAMTISHSKGLFSGNYSQAKSEKHFIFVCPFTEGVYWQDCIRGIKFADETFSVQTEIMGPSSAEAFIEEMPAYMQAAINKNPDGILVYAGVPEVADLINVAADRGIPVVVIDSDAPDTKRIAYVGTDLYELGYSCGETMVDLCKGEGEIAYVCTAKNIENEAYVYSAFKDAIHDYSMPIVAEVEAGNSAEKAAEAMSKILKEYPNIKGIFTTGGINTTGIGIACKELNRTDINMVGLDDSYENLELVRNEGINALYAQNPYQMGYQGVKLLKTYTDDGVAVKSSILTGVMLITKDNVDSYKEYTND